MKKASTCRWFPKCQRKAIAVSVHPLYGEVPICDICSALKRVAQREQRQLRLPLDIGTRTVTQN